MSYIENRDTIISRVKKELIGPGSDIFFNQPDDLNEIIGDKPLKQYFSGILFPKQSHEEEADTGEEQYATDNEDDIFQNDPNLDEPVQNSNTSNAGEKNGDDNDTPDTVPKYHSNTFFPSHMGISFCVDENCKELNLKISFGNYRKAKYNEVQLPYEGSDLQLLNKYGLDQFVSYNEENKTLVQTKEVKRTVSGQITSDYQQRKFALDSMRKDHRNSGLYKHLIKLFFKDKYKRINNEIPLSIGIDNLLNADDNHLEIVLSKQDDVDSSFWHKANIDNLVLHLKLYGSNANKYFIKAILENRYAHKKSQFSLAKEKLNQLALFQVEISANSKHLLPFRDYQPNLYKTDEDKMLDYLFREKLAYGIGHNTSCIWEHSEEDIKKPNWIKTTFLPEYNVKSQSTEIDRIDTKILSIKSLSSYNDDKEEILNNLRKIASAYSEWIEEEIDKIQDNEYGKQNIERCQKILDRINNGIELLKNDATAFKAFQLANTAIYLQMFQNQWHFSERKGGYEAYERDGNLQLPLKEYASVPFPSKDKKEPEWRPFQLAFILQCIPSFVKEDGSDRELVDLLYFPTGGGKTEAYLAISAFLIFWRRLKFPQEYDGVNIIIRYTLRLLSAQQFERATKLILACEYIRQHHRELGNERISIGFWIGSQTIPNKHKNNRGTGAFDEFNKIAEKLNNGEAKFVTTPFQITNCQWCNTKIISKLKEEDKAFAFGHRHNGNELSTNCLNSNCAFSENNGGLPVSIVDEDIYRKPPTMLFGTVDKFAQIAWEGNATNLFNYETNRKPELIIQDELHLLNGPLGSLVGLFENAILSLCTTEQQKPKIIASTATVKNVDAQIEGLYGRNTNIFPQYASSSDDSFFSQTLPTSKRKYIGILPTGKTIVMTNLQLLAALFFARVEIWEKATDKNIVDPYWTILSYFKSLKELGRFSNKIIAELAPIIQQLQVRHIKNQGNLPHNYWKLAYRSLELTSRIPNERIKKNLDKLEISFNGNLKEHKSYDLVLATNMISVGLDVERLNVMVMNGMPPNTAEYIQASSRVARRNEGLVITMYDPFNTRDLSYFEDFVQFHKTFYKQVEPLSVTPFADNALDKMLFTVMIAFFRHKMGYPANNMASAFIENHVKTELQKQFSELFKNHPFAQQSISQIGQKIGEFLQNWQYKLDAEKDLKFFWYQHPDKSLMKPIQDKKNDEDKLVAMQSMRSVEPNAEIVIKPQ
ncbi:MAG: helicase-related protein [bacterium]